MFIAIYITYPDNKTAEEICGQLLNKKLVACANIHPIKSMYWWKGEIKKEDEVVSIVKTTSERWDEVKLEIEKLHPYETPCIMRLEADANKAYEDWIKDETKKEQ